MPNWSDLPYDIALEILHCLHINVVDVIRFGAVCKPWHQVTLLTPPKPPPLQFPWLMLTSPDTTTNFSFRFLNLSNNTLYYLPPPPYQPPPPPPSRTTTNGWFFMFQTDLDCSLINPITKQQIPLPQTLRSFFLPTPRQKLIRSFPSPHCKSLIRKAVFSSPPNQQNCIVLVISQSAFPPLLFCKLNQTEWIPIVHQFNGFLTAQLYQDIIYFNNQFYAVDAYGRIFAFDLNANPPSCQQITAPFPIRAYNTYLVEVDGELVYVSRFKDAIFGVSLFFCYKQNKDTKEWEQIDDLRDHSIFLGFNQSGSLLASNYPVCRRNVIYFTDYDHDNPVGNVKRLPPVLVTTSMC